MTLMSHDHNVTCPVTCPRHATKPVEFRTETPQAPSPSSAKGPLARTSGSPAQLPGRPPISVGDGVADTASLRGVTLEYTGEGVFHGDTPWGNTLDSTGLALGPLIAWGRGSVESACAVLPGLQQ